MSGIQISKTGKSILRKASRDAIAEYFQALSPTDRQTKWLPKTNRYRVTCVDRYSRDTTSDPPSVDKAEMIAYVAASGPGHVIDGWSFLARSVDALLRNDVYSAIHFGYYAELRAAMAILAAEGVGILNDRHPVVDRNGNIQNLPKAQKWNQKSKAWNSFTPRTHAIVWPCVRHWSGLSKSFDLVDEVFRPADISLGDWLARLGSSVSVKAVTQRWISIWGIDLSHLDSDHESRNLASYRPSSLRPPHVPEVDEILDFVTGLWKCFEPSNYGRFTAFERHLVRRALKSGKVNLPLSQGALAPIGIFNAEEAAWLRVLNSTNEPRFFEDAELTSSLENKGSHFQVLSRAVLLLNLATAAARRHLREANFTAMDLKFWWHSHGVDRGLWEQHPVPNPLDSWADISELLGDTDAWLAANGKQGSLAQWRKNQSSSLNFISAFELVGMWGLLP